MRSALLAGSDGKGLVATVIGWPAAEAYEQQRPRRRFHFIAQDALGDWPQNKRPDPVARIRPVFAADYCIFIARSPKIRLFPHKRT